MTFADIQKHFGFRSLKIGAWVSADEKESRAALFFDALSDLQDILQAPSVLLSLRSSLSLNYGTGGQPGVMAHYEPASQTFALAKNAGPGAIAHEWFHAFDHYIAPFFLQDTGSYLFASQGYWEGVPIKPHPLNQQLALAFYEIFYADAKATPSAYVQRSLAYDNTQPQRYFSEPYELAARAFEAAVQDASIKNEFLARGTKASREAKAGLYPQARERLRIQRALFAYFHALSHRLNSTL